MTILSAPPPLKSPTTRQLCAIPPLPRALLPGALIEALAPGCPAASTDCRSGPSEILEDPDLLAPVGDAAALARAMLRALDRPVDREALRARAARFSADRAADAYETLIEEVLAERS